MAREGIQIGHYRFTRLLGRGGMGEVYLAEDLRINRNVAIKIVLDEVAPYPQSNTANEAAHLFEREMKAITSLDHPHILPLYEFGEEKVNGENLIYMVMPFRPEGSLVDWLHTFKNAGELRPEEIVPLIQQAASALNHAHTHHVIHLDVKPSNFLIRSQEDTPDHPDLLLADFGISKFNSGTATASESIRGTPVYMAPEQWSGKPVPATDQYALAIMAYQLLTGQTPFQGNMHQAMYQHFHELPKAPSEFNTSIPDSVNKIILHALAKNPEDRFSSIVAFASAFAQAWQDEPTSLSPTLLVERRPIPPTQYTLPHPSAPLASLSIAKVPDEPRISSPKRSSMRWLPLLFVLAVLLAGSSLSVLLFHLLAPSPGAAPLVVASRHATGSNHSAATLPTTMSPSPTLPKAAPTSTRYVQLKPFYRGTASGYLHATVTFTLESEDSQGNVTMQTTFQQVADPQKFATYTCQGSVSTDQHLYLNCTANANANYLLTINGFIFPDGHMEGTEVATIINDSNYNHFYNWSAA
jgi:serine/threonine protein kinase